MSNETTTGWIDVCAVDDVPVLGSRVLARSAGPNIAIFRNADDEVFALHDRCPHKDGPLSQGIVFGRKVACPLHNWNIDLENGCALAPDVGAAATCAVKVENGRVFLGEQKSEHVPAPRSNKQATDAPAVPMS
jgi:nitrite reductase (NADH) small subunit